jgi:protein subunit release factor B
MEKWRNRVAAATLFPAYSKTISNLVGRPMSRGVSFEAKDADTSEWMKNVDRMGRDINQFMSSVLNGTIAYGHWHVVVDFPVVSARTREDEKKAGARPYFVEVRPTQVLGWKATEDGRLLQVRYMELVPVDGQSEFETSFVEQIRVLEPNRWRTYRKAVAGAKTGEWVMHKEGVVTLGEVPFVTFYGRRDGFMRSRPPMAELAHLNIKHWQHQSDQDNILHVARVPILTASGVDEDFKMEIGSESLTRLPAGATLAYTEHTGAAVSAGAAALKDLLEEMKQAGAEMLVERPGQRTATEVAGEASSNLSDLQRIVADAEDTLNIALSFVARWSNNRPVEATIFNDFHALDAGAESAGVISTIAASGIISKQTGFDELKRRGVIDANHTWEDEQERIEQEGPAEPPEPSTGPLS